MYFTTARHPVLARAKSVRELWLLIESRFHFGNLGVVNHFDLNLCGSWIND